MPNNHLPITIDGKSDIDRITETLISFIRDIGISVHEENIPNDTFLPGLLICNGDLVIDRNKLSYPGDILHEAGHMAVVLPGVRKEMNEETIRSSRDREAEEMMAIAWSYAACIHLKINPLVVFHEHGYKGDGKSIVENFDQQHYFGVPMLQWIGLTVDEKRAKALGIAPYPAMIKWLR